MLTCATLLSDTKVPYDTEPEKPISIGVSSAAVGRFARHANVRTLDFKLTAHFARYLPAQDRFRQPVFAYHHLILQHRRMLVRIRLRRTPRSQHYRAMEVIHLNPKM